MDTCFDEKQTSVWCQALMWRDLVCGGHLTPLTVEEMWLEVCVATASQWDSGTGTATRREGTRRGKARHSKSVPLQLSTHAGHCLHGHCYPAYPYIDLLPLEGPLIEGILRPAVPYHVETIPALTYVSFVYVIYCRRTSPTAPHYLLSCTVKKENKK